MKSCIETERLILREIISADLEGMFELDSNPQVHRFLGNKPVKHIDESRLYIEKIRQQYTGNGIVHSCRKDDKSFILTIQIDEDSLFRHRSELDPGIFAVEDFLTEQQEAEILTGL